MAAVCPMRAYPGPRSRGLGMRSAGLVLALLACVGAARAQWTTTNPVAYAVQGGAGIVVGSPAASVQSGSALLSEILSRRSYAPVAGVAGSVNINEVTKGINPKPGGLPIDVAMKRALQWSAIARGAAKALPLISTALAVKELFDEVRCRESFSGGGECDEGQPQIQQIMRCTASGTLASGAVSGTGGQSYYVAGPICAVSNAEIGAALCADVNADAPAAACTVLSVEPSRVLIRINTGGGFLTSNWINTSPQSTIETCPAWTDSAGVVHAVGSPLGPDGKCPTGAFLPYPETVLAERIDDYGGKARAPGLVPVLDAAGVPMDHPAPQYTPPAVIQGERETTQLPDGRTITRDTDYPMEATPEGYKWRDRVVEREWPAGVTPDPVGAPPGGSTPPGTTTDSPGTSAPAPVEFKTCGLPDTPPCKIDEGGTPPPPPPPADPDDLTGPIRASIENPEVADTSWTFSFQLPAACSVIEVGNFGGREISLDLCRYQPMIHELVSLLWIGATFWFALGIMMRAFGGS